VSAPPLILNVDDNEGVRYATTRVLKQAGYRVQEAGTGEEALAAAAGVDLVILDVKLPGMSGFEVCRRLKGDPALASVPVLNLTSAYGSGEHWATALDAGADAYLTHPVEPVVLVATVRSLLRTRDAESERARLLESERAARREAEEANRLKDEFLATLSHELRTPLNAIVGWTTILRSRPGDPALTGRAVSVIERNARSLKQLIEDILDVSRVVTGKLRLAIAPMDLCAVVEAALESVRPSAEAKQIALAVDCPPAAGAMDGDADRVHQIVWNLLSNAVKFTPEGGHVTVRARRDDAHVQLEVADTGVGIEEEFLPYIFDRFRQADSSSTRRHGGLGLGLAIARHLAELHGGTVQARSPGPGQGTTFTVRLPARAARAAAPATLPGAPPTPASEAPSGAAAGRLDGLRVLVVEDEPDTLDLVATILRERGATVEAVATTQDARDALARLRPDLLLSDIGLPGEDGLALMRAIRTLAPEQGGQVPAVALTAYAREQDRAQALHAGFQAHLPKPIQPQDLVRVISQVLSSGIHRS
jgi:signal transduction histidine kinase